ncbi:hypothetical protein C1H46_035049 [Malus baccata]|uniref:Uncharacterized protein n=1 Tax=Malus baccata TaxID=106549 RepID=A0A540KZ80_MALBA|nr:hypothetical protein C1H46_035049 [Malus baccata]
MGSEDDLHNRERGWIPNPIRKGTHFSNKGKRERERAMAVVENAGVELGKSVGSNSANRNPVTSTTPQNGGAVTAPNNPDLSKLSNAAAPLRHRIDQSMYVMVTPPSQRQHQQQHQQQRPGDGGSAGEL